MKNFPGLKFGTSSKTWWGKNEITQYYTPVTGEWS
jgi:hypothetical protein